MGEFSNHGMDYNQTESADFDGLFESKDSFIGRYLTTWRNDKSSILMDLNISHKPSSEGRIFDLEWFEGKSKVFKGQGFLCDNILIGDYTDKINL